MAVLKRPVVSIIFVLVLQCCYAIRDLHKDTEGGFGLELTDFKSNVGFPNSKHAKWDLGKDFRLFGSEKDSAFVHFNGFMTFDFITAETLGDEQCQINPDHNFDVIAPYWRHYDHGKLYVAEYKKEVVEPSSSVVASSSFVVPSTTLFSSISTTVSLVTSNIQSTSVVPSSFIVPSTTVFSSISSTPVSSLTPNIQSTSVFPSTSVVPSTTPSTAASASTIGDLNKIVPSPSVTVVSMSTLPATATPLSSSVSPVKISNNHSTGTYTSTSSKTLVSISSNNVQPSLSMLPLYSSSNAISVSVSPMASIKQSVSSVLASPNWETMSIATNSIQPSLSISSSTSTPIPTLIASMTSNLQSTKVIASPSSTTVLISSSSSIQPSLSVTTSTDSQPQVVVLSDAVIQPQPTAKPLVRQKKLVELTDEIQPFTSCAVEVTDKEIIGLQQGKLSRETKAPSLSKISVDQIALDLNSTFEVGKLQNEVEVKRRSNITGENVQRIIVFTWQGMYSDAETVGTKRYFHHFQAALVKVNEQWFVQYYYAALSSGGNWDVNKTPGGQKCLLGATMGIGRRIAVSSSNDPFFQGVYSSPYLSPSFIEIVSNEFDWRDLGSWVFDLNADVENQPQPSRWDCTATPSQVSDTKCNILLYAAAVKNDKKRRRRRRRDIHDNHGYYEYDTNMSEITDDVNNSGGTSSGEGENFYTTRENGVSSEEQQITKSVTITTAASSNSHESSVTRTTEQGIFTTKPTTTEQGIFTTKPTTTEQGIFTTKPTTTEQGIFTTEPTTTDENGETHTTEIDTNESKTTKNSFGIVPTPRIPPSVTDFMQLLANKFCKYRDPGLYQLPSICDVFISCNLGRQARPLVCPEGTSFNPRILVCDYSSNFECSRGNIERSRITTVKPATPQHENLCQYMGYGEYPDPLSCNNYYACTNARTIKMPCPAGLFFKPTNSTTGYCEYARKVDCLKGVRGGKDDERKHPRQLF